LSCASLVIALRSCQPLSSNSPLETCSQGLNLVQFRSIAAFYSTRLWGLAPHCLVIQNDKFQLQRVVGPISLALLPSQSDANGQHEEKITFC
jgi:hypothetical protein